MLPKMIGFFVLLNIPLLVEAIYGGEDVTDLTEAPYTAKLFVSFFWSFFNLTVNSYFPIMI